MRIFGLIGPAVVVLQRIAAPFGEGLCVLGLVACSLLDPDFLMPRREGLPKDATRKMCSESVLHCQRPAPEYRPNCRPRSWMYSPKAGKPEGNRVEFQVILPSAVLFVEGHPQSVVTMS